ncbi:siderophore-interacting protein [Gordonia sp. PKS22-38]|uniref:Siderophore-interacting protein n=1 Tax=Gordonia prachuapensis TaxID=3115651 RepID=A0ABU7MTV5_9ACTN|nr:siderophore-interacting protein [Gordonia sp. PKS22-38]
MGHSFAHVIDATDLNPRLRRIRLEVPDLDSLGLHGAPDDAVGIYFPAADQSSPPPMEHRDGVWGYHDPATAPDARSYSIRTVDHHARTIDVDFVVHARGPATSWAQRARPGDGVMLAHPRGWYRPPPAIDWCLLAADLAGLPALARILEDRTESAAAIAVVEVFDRTDLDYLPHTTGTDVIPIVGSGNGFGPSALATTIRGLELPPGQGYCWFAGEAAESRAVRKYLRHEHRWGRDHYDIIGYWRADGDEWSRRYAQHGEELFAVYQRAIADGLGEKAAAEAFDEELERRGL